MTMHPAQERLASILRELGAVELAGVVEAGVICCAPNPFGELPPCLLELPHDGRLHRANWSDEDGLHTMEWASDDVFTLLRRRDLA